MKQFCLCSICCVMYWPYDMCISANALANAVKFHSVKLTKELLAEDHVQYLQDCYCLTKREARVIEKTPGSENRVECKTVVISRLDST